MRIAKTNMSVPSGETDHYAETSDGKHGRPADRPSFADLLLTFPGGIEFERDLTPLREVDL
jgi:hypothetical protein